VYICTPDGLQHDYIWTLIPQIYQMFIHVFNTSRRPEYIIQISISHVVWY